MCPIRDGQGRLVRKRGSSSSPEKIYTYIEYYMLNSGELIFVVTLVKYCSSLSYFFEVVSNIFGFRLILYFFG